jgi:hypothetical protein
MHSEDDQIVPYVAAGPLSAKLLKNGTLKNLQGLPARDAHYGSGHDQFRPVGIHQKLATRQTCFLRAVPIRYHRFQTITVDSADVD